MAYACDQDISRKGERKVQSCLERFLDIFRVCLRTMSPALLRTTMLRLKTGSLPVIPEARRYKSEPKKFLNKYIDELKRVGFVRINPKAQCAAAPPLLSKDFKAKFSMTVELRLIKSSNVAMSGPMPRIDSEIYEFSKSSVFATMNSVRGY